MFGSDRVEQDMAKRRMRTKLVYGADAHYWPERMKPLWIAVALIGVVAERRRSVREKLEEAVEAWAAPGLKLLYEQVMAEVPEQKIGE